MDPDNLNTTLLEDLGGMNIAEKNAEDTGSTWEELGEVDITDEDLDEEELRVDFEDTCGGITQKKQGEKQV